MSSRWYVVKVRSRHEKLVAQALRHKEYGTLLPLYRSTTRTRESVSHALKPAFPGYVFAEFDAQFRLPVLKTPGVVDIVGFGGVPAPVENEEIEHLQSITASGLLALPCAFLRSGQKVRIESGPLYGVEGILLAARNEHRLVVSVSLLQRSVSVEVLAEWLVPIGPLATGSILAGHCGERPPAVS